MAIVPLIDSFGDNYNLKVQQEKNERKNIHTLMSTGFRMTPFPY